MRFLLVSVFLAATFVSFAPTSSTAQPVTVAELMGKNAKLLPAGRYRIGKKRMRCGSAKTLVSTKFWDYGGALPNLIIINPRKMNRLPRSIRKFVYYHECAHQTVGADEVAADCQAIRRGKKEGWLRKRDVKRICKRLFIHSKGDRYHPPGPKRCRLLMQCYEGRGRTRTARRGTGFNTLDSR